MNITFGRRYRTLQTCWLRIKSITLGTLARDTQRRFPPKYIANTIKVIQSTFRCLEMRSKQRYKICICSVILWERESFRNYKGLSIIFPKNLDAI